MSRVLVTLALLAAAACSDGEAAPPDPVQPFAVEAQACDRPQPRRGLATPIGDDLVITAGHVVEGDLRRLDVDGRPASVAAHDATLDLAIVAVGHDRPLPEVVTIAPERATIVTVDGARPDVGARAITLRVDDLDDGEVYERPALRLAIDVSPGDSGAPVLNDDGALVGVLTLRRSSDDGSYATTLQPLQTLLERAHDAAERGEIFAPGEACV